MKVLDRMNMGAKIELAVAKAEREKFPFSLIAIGLKQGTEETDKLLRSIIRTQMRDTDTIGTTGLDVYIILLDSTVKSEAQLYLDRLIKNAVLEDGLSIYTSIEQYKEGDEEMDIMLRLMMKLRW